MTPRPHRPEDVYRSVVGWAPRAHRAPHSQPSFGIANLVGTGCPPYPAWFKTVDAARNDEARNALIGTDKLSRVLYVVHIDFEDDHIRIISARPATSKERQHYGEL
ncbi:MAG: BrnT family toxin [Betaproteobacteria bacterium]|nr:MAG: BrnT family toxin [Betaproteobacteria bacterium]